MVETVQVKQEVDDPHMEPFLPPPSSSTRNQMAPHTHSDTDNGSAAAAETVELNNLLCSGKQLFEKLCFVKLQGKDSEGYECWWPALEYSKKKELYDDVKKNVDQSLNRSTFFKLANNLLHSNDQEVRGCHSIAFLLGKPAIEDSIIVLGEGMVVKYEDRIDELLRDDDYKDNERFMEAVKIVNRRIDELFRDDDNKGNENTQANRRAVGEDEDDEATVAFDSGETPPRPSSSSQASSSPSFDDQTSVSTSSNNEASMEVITIEDTPTKSGGKDIKREGESKYDGTASKKKKDNKDNERSMEANRRAVGEDEDDEATVAFDSGETPPRPSSSSQASSSPSFDDQTSVSTSSNNEASMEVITIEDTPTKSGGKDNKREGESKNDGTASKKKKKTSKHTPKSKSRGTQPTMVSPLPLPSTSDDKEVSKHLRNACFTPHKVMKHDEAWKLLEAKFGFSCGEDGKFYLPPTSDSEDAKPVATSLTGLRKDLCAKGLPESIQPLSTEEKIDIARWVRYAHVKLEDGQQINDLGEPISKFMDEAAWPLLRDNFGCSWNGTYKVRLTPHGEETKTFETTRGVDAHFARFGIQCIPDDPGHLLSREGRLSIELFFATPSSEVLNTFERVDENAKRKRKRNRVSYGE